MFSQTTSFRNGCCNDSSAVMRFDGSNVSMRSNRSKASTGILGRKETLTQLIAIYEFKMDCPLSQLFKFFDHHHHHHCEKACLGTKRRGVQHVLSC